MEVERYGTLKGLLVQKNIKQEDLANQIGMDRTTFNIKINRYRGRDFTLSEAIAISKAIQEPIDNFFWFKSILKETRKGWIMEKEIEMIHLMEQMDQKIEMLIEFNKFLLRIQLISLASQNYSNSLKLNSYLADLHESVFESDFLENLCQ